MKKIGKIKDACIVIAGQSPKGTSYNDYGEGLEFHQGKKAFGETVIENSNVWTTEITKIAEPGDILMSVRAPVGPTNITDRKICIGRGLAAIRCNKDVIPQYILYALRNIESKIIGNDGAVFNSINKNQIEDLPLPLITLSEQQSIVDYLDSAFAKIDAMKANAEKALIEAKALFQASLKEMLKPKEGWEEKKLEEICTHIVDCPHTTPRKVNHPTQYPCIRTSELKEGKIEWESMQYLDEDEYIIRTSRIKPQANDIVYGREGTYGDAVLLPDGYFFSLGQRTMLFRPDIKSVVPQFLHYSVISSYVYKQAKAKNSGCGVGHVNVKDIKLFIIGIPKTLSEQQSIVATLDSIKSKVDRLQANYEKISKECDALKQAILRQVFE